MDPGVDLGKFLNSLVPQLYLKMVIRVLNLVPQLYYFKMVIRVLNLAWQPGQVSEIRLCRLLPCPGCCATCHVMFLGSHQNLRRVALYPFCRRGHSRVDPCSDSSLLSQGEMQVASAQMQCAFH